MRLLQVYMGTCFLHARVVNEAREHHTMFTLADPCLCCSECDLLAGCKSQRYWLHMRLAKPADTLRTCIQHQPVILKNQSSGTSELDGYCPPSRCAQPRACHAASAGKAGIIAAFNSIAFCRRLLDLLVQTHSSVLVTNKVHHWQLCEFRGSELHSNMHYYM